MTQEQLYDSEATLRLVDSALDDLQLAEPQRPVLYRAVQLRPEAPASEEHGTADLRVYWGLQAALETLIEGRSELLPPRLVEEPDPDRLSRALALVDLLGSEELDPARAQAYSRLRDELLSLACERHAEEEMGDTLRRASGLLHELEQRLSRLTLLVHG